MAQVRRKIARRFRRTPGFFAFSILLIAAVVGGNTMVFSLVDALLLRPLPVRNPKNLVQVFERRPNLPLQRWFEGAFYRQLAGQSSTLTDVMGMNQLSVAMEHGGQVSRVEVAPVTENFFPSLSPAVLAGRGLMSGDDHVAVLSYSTWARSFGRDREALGQRIRLAGHIFEIVGVLSEDFNGTTVEVGPDVWVPRRNFPDFVMYAQFDPERSVIEIIARLKPHVPVAEAQAEVATRWRNYEERDAPDRAERRDWLADSQLEMQPIALGVSPLRSQFRTSLTLILAGTGLLLLIVSFNVGGLSLARSLVYHKETALRLALGASRLRIVRQILLESSVVTGIGGILGVLFAYMGIPLFLHWIPPIQVGGGELRTVSLAIHPDVRVIAFCITICGLATVLSAFAPAWQCFHMDLQTALRSAGSDLRQSRVQLVLCALQIALCTLLLLCAGLMVHSLSRLEGLNPGFDREHVATFSIDPRMRRYSSEQTWLLQQRLLAEVRKVPGIQAAGIANTSLMRGVGMKTTVVLPGQKLDGHDLMNSSLNNITPGYLDAMGIPVLEGRSLRERDLGRPAPAPVLVNDAFVRRFLGGGEAMGRQFATGKQFRKSEFEIVGVVGDTQYRSMRETPPPIFYSADFGPKVYPGSFALCVRSRGDPRKVVEPVRKVLHSLDPEMPFYETAILTEEIDRSLWQERLIATLASSFALFAELLSGIGLYSILSYFVSGHKREIGIRIALGAKTSDVVALISKRVLLTVAGGAHRRTALLCLGWRMDRQSPLWSFSFRSVIRDFHAGSVDRGRGAGVERSGYAGAFHRSGINVEAGVTQDARDIGNLEDFLLFFSSYISRSACAAVS